MITTTLKLKGLHCPACKKLTEKRIGSLPDVIEVTTNIVTGDATIQANRPILPTEVATALAGTPYSL